ncbi:GIN domain-containing protein [Nitrospirillum iridis]|uniref:Auto-transporter adhesin head GIN domain-containing protein n=1 Tax=Nitrospirillum iridis TaxID=765888 RepID=A0A7X0AYN6_9PROT|nr:hypothetical protein [Nitrospirillum iridis]MBB6252573.1 hypothetical protein [Nitrospirillum iridis]
METSVLPPRPRLTPGIPAGGVIAIIVVVVSLGFTFIGRHETGSSHATKVKIKMDGSIPPIPPIPPMAPVAPVAPVSPISRADADQIRRDVEEAMKGLDVDAIKRDAMAAATAARAAARDARALSDASQEFPAQPVLNLANLSGNTVIRPSDSTTVITVTSSGGAVRAAAADGSLQISGSGRSTELTITVPSKTKLVATGLSGELTVDGALDGDVVLDVRKAEVSLKKVKSLQANIAESGEVSVDEVTESLKFIIAGHGDLHVGRAADAEIRVMGQADISLGTISKALRLAVYGNGDVSADRVDGVIETVINGRGDIHITDGSADQLKVAVLGQGDFTFDGTAKDPNLFMGGSGTITIAKHTGTPRIGKSGSGDIVLGGE